MKKKKHPQTFTHSTSVLNLKNNLILLKCTACSKVKYTHRDRRVLSDSQLKLKTLLRFYKNEQTKRAEKHKFKLNNKKDIPLHGIATSICTSKS